MSSHSVDPDSTFDLEIESDEPVRVLDLFCGGGGLTKAIADVIKESGRDLEMVALNHDPQSIETHQANHDEYAAQFCVDAGADLAGPGTATKPSNHFGDPDTVGAPTVHLMGAGIECVGHSNARGGKPVKPQDRVSAWYALSYVEKLLPERLIFENVPQFKNFGPLFSDDGEDDGSMFEIFIKTLNTLGYNIDWEVLTAADYGDAQLRDRLIILGSRDGTPTFPDPTHSPDGEKPNTIPYRTAADIIDWDDPGESIWSRDMTGRQRVLSYNTMQRIAAGIEKYAGPELAPIADFLKTLGRDQDIKSEEGAKHTIPELRDKAVPLAYAPLYAQITDEPFLVRLDNNTNEKYSLVMGSTSSPIETTFRRGRHSSHRQERCGTLGTLAGATHSPFDSNTMIVRQFGGAQPTAITDPLPTIATDGAHALATTESTLILPRDKAHRGIHSNPAYPAADQPLHTVTAKNHSGWMFTPTCSVISSDRSAAPLPSYLCMGYSERKGQSPRIRSLSRPLPTIPAKKIPAALSTPYLTDYHGQGTTFPIDEPLRTIECKDRFGLAHPSTPLVGFDLKYRMLKPLELARGQGFPDDYEFTGNKTERTQQIGNAIPINMARAIVQQLLSETVPTIDSFNDSPIQHPTSEQRHSVNKNIEARIQRMHQLMESPPTT